MMTTYFISESGVVHSDKVPAYLMDWNWTIVDSSMTFSQVREVLCDVQWNAFMDFLRVQRKQYVPPQPPIPEPKIWVILGESKRCVEFIVAAVIADLLCEEGYEVHFEREGDRKPLVPVMVPGGGCVDFDVVVGGGV